ncbi:DEAD/DEAH box helicase [Bacillus pinisoli]|uniref:DEAD/DEAH box helicase n=1 Tax=Bacillus pinisoli TaxID=2901866 RepID=UPI001FF5281D|nr:DEAD/DEAH box helicase [Bacillus pinisoli]
MQNFIQLGVSQPLQHALKKNGIAVPTPIQEQAIPHILAGRDVLAQAQTGTGKTISFILPILDQINIDQGYIQALIVSPTRELAIQITNEFQKYKSEEINVLAVYGGQDVERQLKRLAGNVHIVVGTPGRILDHLRRETIELQNVSMLVLDEADQMLHIGFINEVETIISETSSTRQTMLFSATLTDQVKKVSQKYLRNPVSVKIAEEHKTLDEIKQLVYETTDRQKQASLCQIIDEHRPFLAVIFCRTKRRADKLYENLKGLGYNCDVLHGDLSQPKRERVMDRFREADIQYLIATDVAARGLDVEGVTHVFNYDLPEDVDSYIHRIGRTGRAGSKGLAITFVTPKDFSQLKIIEKGIGLTLPKRTLVKEVQHTEKTGRNDNQERVTNQKKSNPGSSKKTRSNQKETRSGRKSKSIMGTRVSKKGNSRSTTKSNHK